MLHSFSHLLITAVSLECGYPASSIRERIYAMPEAPGVVNRDTSVVVRELFAGAEDSVLVAGYAVYQGQQVFRALADRMVQRPDLRVRMFLDVQRGPGDTSAPPGACPAFRRAIQESAVASGPAPAESVLRSPLNRV